jgi:hypothetical protein
MAIPSAPVPQTKPTFAQSVFTTVCAFFGSQWTMTSPTQVEMFVVSQTAAWDGVAFTQARSSSQFEATRMHLKTTMDTFDSVSTASANFAASPK